MKNRILFLGVLITSLLPFSSKASPGGCVSGGGDILRIEFEKGRKLSSAISKTVQTKHWNWWGNNEIQDQSLRKWLFENQHSFTTELQELTLEYRKENPNGLCAQTELAEKATVYLSTEKCRGYTELEAAQQLFVEAAHHFGFKDREADFLALNLMQIYKSSRNFDGPLWAIGRFGSSEHSVGVSPTGSVHTRGTFSTICFNDHCYNIDWNSLQARKTSSEFHTTGSATITAENLFGDEKIFICSTDITVKNLGGDFYQVIFRACEWPEEDKTGSNTSIPASKILINQIVRKWNW